MNDAVRLVVAIGVALWLCDMDGTFPLSCYLGMGNFGLKTLKNLSSNTCSGFMKGTFIRFHEMNAGYCGNCVVADVG